MSDHVYKRHNKSLLLYHIVCPVNYRRKVISDTLADILKATCIEISDRYEIHFVEIDTDIDHVHFLVQSVPMMLPKGIVQTIKSITARELFKQYPEVQRSLWGGKFWTSGYYINTVGQYGNEAIIKEYVKKQGLEYQQIYRSQLKLFDGIA